MKHLIFTGFVIFTAMNSIYATSALAVETVTVKEGEAKIEQHEKLVKAKMLTTRTAIEKAHKISEEHKKKFEGKLGKARAEFEREYKAAESRLASVDNAFANYRKKRLASKDRIFGLSRLRTRVSWLWHDDKYDLQHEENIGKRYGPPINGDYMPSQLTQPNLVRKMDKTTLLSHLNNMKLVMVEMVEFYNKVIRPNAMNSIRNKVMDETAYDFVNDVDMALFRYYEDYAGDCIREYTQGKSDRCQTTPLITLYIEKVAQSFPAIVNAPFVQRALAMEAELLAFQEAVKEYQAVELNRMASGKGFDMESLIPATQGEDAEIEDTQTQDYVFKSKKGQELAKTFREIGAYKREKKRLIEYDKKQLTKP